MYKRIMGQRQIKAARRAAANPPPWTTFEPVTMLTKPGGEIVPVPAGYAIFRNSRYTVWRRKIQPGEDWPEPAWLSVKRNDRQPIHDWRDLQRIKNELVGEESEGVELYPAKSRLVDGANQYHLYVMIDPGKRFPFGFTDRLVSDDQIFGEVQRPFEPGMRPGDCNHLTAEQRAGIAAARS